ncbi:MAG: hypothetical protein ACRELB_27585 [Polyangiaceae bacterium]
MLTACAGRPGTAPAAAAASAEPVPWRYQARLRGDDLYVEARFAPGTTGALHTDSDAAPFVHDTSEATESGWRVVRYRFALGEASRRLMDAETAIAAGDVFVAPPSTWLLRPESEPPGAFRVEVATDPPARFLAGTHPAPGGAPSTLAAPTGDLEDAGFAVFGPFHEETVASGTARVHLAIAPAGLDLTDADVTSWATMAVSAIAGYLHRPFPVPRTVVAVLRGKGGPTRGETMGVGGPTVLLRAGDGVTAAKTRDDWVLTHELIHVVMPSLGHEHVWLSEGIASYVEPLARVRLGTLPRETMWHDLVEGMPQGLPEAGDEGLEKTHTWGRTYWGGALFCLLADVRIREQTASARSFGDVIRAVVATGDDVEAHWEIERFLDVGDAATGTRVLHDLHRELGLAPGTVDLPALWRRLGVAVDGDRVRLDDTAPLAAVRRGIAGR